MLTKNWKIRKKSKELDYIKFELLFIKTKKETFNYKLELPKYAKVYFIFHLLLLKLVDLTILIQNIFYHQV